MLIVLSFEYVNLMFNNSKTLPNWWGNTGILCKLVSCANSCLSWEKHEFANNKHEFEEILEPLVINSCYYFNTDNNTILLFQLYRSVQIQFICMFCAPPYRILHFGRTMYVHLSNINHITIFYEPIDLIFFIRVP